MELLKFLLNSNQYSNSVHTWGISWNFQLHIIVYTFLTMMKDAPLLLNEEKTHMVDTMAWSDFVQKLVNNYVALVTTLSEINLILHILQC